ncbi:hypothetical protein VIBC2010_07904 [Vibrio caribbeanicus ATCC BAA-2122]|uniref:Uncharacterized protein n=1 Tax=Vibrio caribbeanicus ATCC BAA-2122 TaxID=796620 RepID=E3BJV8_9VIBR|nr:hypothetical protein VIBC2010_07904 [Vibrio caribbeanicus ATCC BAA-2122]
MGGRACTHPCAFTGFYIQTKQTKRKGTANADAIFVNANNSLISTSRFGDTDSVENIVADVGVFISPLSL